MELGRGGMGVTYKAIDTHLQCPLALKIISAQFIGNESARSGFGGSYPFLLCAGSILALQSSKALSEKVYQ